MRLLWKTAGATMVAVVALAGGTLASARAGGFDPPACPASGHITYQLGRGAVTTAEAPTAYDAIDTAMRKAVTFYNCYVDATANLRVSYEPSVQTADAASSGSIRFGSNGTMQQVTAMHEISHVLGIGTAPAWASHVSDGIWHGDRATAVLRDVTHDPSAVLHADNQHFWPFGLNYTSEAKSVDDLVGHCLLVTALRQDLGL